MRSLLLSRFHSAIPRGAPPASRSWTRGTAAAGCAGPRGRRRARARAPEGTSSAWMFFFLVSFFFFSGVSAASSSVFLLQFLPPRLFRFRSLFSLSLFSSPQKAHLALCQPQLRGPRLTRSDAGWCGSCLCVKRGWERGVSSFNASSVGFFPRPSSGSNSDHRPPSATVTYARLSQRCCARIVVSILPLLTSQPR